MRLTLSTLILLIRYLSNIPLESFRTNFNIVIFVKYELCCVHIRLYLAVDLNYLQNLFVYNYFSISSN